MLNNRDTCAIIAKTIPMCATTNIPLSLCRVAFCGVLLCSETLCWISNALYTIYLKLRHQKVWNLEILNLSERNQNFGVIFWKYQKRNQKSTKFFKTSRKPRVLPLKFHEMSLVSWNLINYYKIAQFLVKFCKSPKDFWKILLKWLGKILP